MTGLLERPDGPESTQPIVRMWDGGATVSGGGGELAIPNTLTIPTGSRSSRVLEGTGFRRFRFKWTITDDAGGISTTRLTLVDLSYNRLTAWQGVAIGPFPFGANVYNFGESVGAFNPFGVFFRVVITNLGPGNIRIQECELWAGA